MSDVTALPVTIAHHRDAYVVGRGVEASDRSHGRPTAISLRSPPS